MSFWLLLLSVATAGLHALGIYTIYLLDRPWFVEMVPSVHWRIIYCSFIGSLTVFFLLNALFILSTYNIYKGTGSAWDIQFAAWGAKWVSPFVSGVLIYYVFNGEHPLVSRGGATALVLYAVAAVVSIYWKTPLFGGR